MNDQSLGFLVGGKVGRLEEQWWEEKDRKVEKSELLPEAFSLLVTFNMSLACRGSHFWVLMDTYGVGYMALEAGPVGAWQWLWTEVLNPSDVKASSRNNQCGGFMRCHYLPLSLDMMILLMRAGCFRAGKPPDCNRKVCPLTFQPFSPMLSRWIGEQVKLIELTTWIWCSLFQRGLKLWSHLTDPYSSLQIFLQRCRGPKA